ncbi:MAG: hypothetical protein VX642_12205 [Bdellovibrionota bacterium]|nr:hypothetical protein [Bdellovibrionota bacterium]
MTDNFFKNISFILALVLLSIQSFSKQSNSDLFIYDYGYKIPAVVWTAQGINILEPQMLNLPQNLAFTESLYRSNALNRVQDKECYINTLVLGVDTRAGDLLNLSKKIHQEDRVLGSRADSINLLQFNRCSKAKPIVYAIYRGNSAPPKCIPSSWEKIPSKEQKSVILADFYNLAGRKEFLTCIKSLFKNKAKAASSIHFPTEVLQSFNKIHYLFEIKKNLNYQLFNRDKVIFPDFVSLLLDIEDTIDNDREIKSHFENNFAARELNFNTMAELGWEFLAEKYWKRKNMAGSGYERSLRIASSLYRTIAFTKFIFESKPELVKKFFPALENNLSASTNISDWYESIGNHLFFDNIDFNQEFPVPPIVQWGAAKNSYIASNGKDLDFVNMDTWKKRFQNIPDLIPLPKQLNLGSSD